MARPRVRGSTEELIHQLREYVHPSTWRAGASCRFTVDAGEGLEVTIELKVARRATRDDAARYRNAALEQLVAFTARTGRRPRCSCHTKARGFLKGGGGQCDARPTGVVVSKGPFDKEGPSFRFMCGRHLPANLIDPAYIVAVVAIPPASIEGAFQRGRAGYEDGRLAKIAAGEAPDAPSCRRCGTDRTCNWCDFTGVVTYGNGLIGPPAAR